MVSRDRVVELCEDVLADPSMWGAGHDVARALLVAWETLGKHMTYHNVREARADIISIVGGAG